MEPERSCSMNRLSWGHSQMPLVHTFDAQSVLPPQKKPCAHLGQMPPPQSLSVSVPFLVWSVHEGFAHKPSVQMPSLQSDPLSHLEPAPQGGQSEPPQSLSVSF